MKIPKKLKIGGHSYEVRIVKDGDILFFAGEGATSRSSHIIEISEDYPQSEKEATLLHEIFHALNSQFDEGINHILIESLSQQLYQVLSDNKMLR